VPGLAREQHLLLFINRGAVRPINNILAARLGIVPPSDKLTRFIPAWNDQ